MSGVVIQILLTRLSDLITGNSLKRWFQQKHKRGQAERQLLVQLGAENHALLESEESRTCSVEKNLRRVKLSAVIYCRTSARDVLFSINLVSYVSISELLVKTCWSKIWNLPIPCSPKVGSRQNRL